MTKSAIKFAIYKDGKRISRFFKDEISAILTGIDKGVFELKGGGTWDSEKREFTYYIASPLIITYGAQTSPVCYEIRKITGEVSYDHRRATSKK